MKGKIYIITHKSIKIPMIETLKEYEIIQTGNRNAPSLGYLNASTKNDIAAFNEYYADLTVHYWIWKNVTCDYVGINHYSRFLFYDNHLITGEEIEKLLREYDVLLPQKYQTDNTVVQQWNSCHYPRDLFYAFYAMITMYPDYLESFEEIMKRKDFYYCTILIARKSVFNAYCEWVFPILEAVRNWIDLNEYPSAYSKRVGAFLSERLLNVWLYHNNISGYELEFRFFPKDEFDV